MKKILTSIILFMTSCSYGSTSSPEVNSFVKKFNKNFPSQNKLQFDGVGLSYPDEKLLLLDLSYVTHEPVDIENARIRMVNLMQEALKAINNDSTMKTILKPYPFTNNEIDLRISFEDESGEAYSTPSKNICFVLAVKNSIIYFIEGGDTGFTSVFKEPYAEAYEKVMGKKL